MWIGFTSILAQIRPLWDLEWKKTHLAYFHVFGIKCYILKNQGNQGKFDSKSDEGVFLGYSPTSRACCALNLNSHKIVEFINIVVDDKAVWKFNEPQVEFIDVFKSSDESESDSETESHHETEAHVDDKDDVLPYRVQKCRHL